MYYGTKPPGPINRAPNRWRKKRGVTGKGGIQSTKESLPHKSRGLSRPPDVSRQEGGGGKFDLKGGTD